MENTDAELLKNCRSGDRDAWESIVRQHHQRIYNLAYRFTGRFDEAEDLTQEIFLKIYRSLHAYRSESGAFTAWVIRVSRNHIVDHYRKFKTERSQTESIETEYDRAEQNPARYATPAEALEQLQLSERIHRMLLKLPSDLREAVILRDLQELTYDEIATMLNVPEGTVKSRINRGRAELARVLKKGGL